MLRFVLCGVLFFSLTISTWAQQSKSSNQDDSIEAHWYDVILPEKPKLEKVTIDPETTALLILDIEERTCNTEKRPRCLLTVPRIASLASSARAAHIPVIYSLTTKGTVNTILHQVTPQPGEPIVSSSVDKFYKTNLESILKDKGVQHIIITGTAAHGAVLNTATAAAFRGFHIILPLDGLSASTFYIEQASVYLLETGPATRNKITLTTTNMISIP